MSAPLSCIITCFCLEKYIGQSLETAFRQTYDGLVQYIIIDDASTDRSRLVIEETIAKFANGLDILFISNKSNLGIAASTDLGVFHAKYEHIVLMDGDDLFPEDRLQKTGELLSRHPDAMMIMGSMIHMNERGVLGKKQGYSALKPYHLLPEEFVLSTADEKLNDYLGNSGIKINAYGTALSFNKKLYFMYGPIAPLDEHLRCSQDGPIEIRALLTGRVVGTKSIFPHYRAHRSNLSNYSYGSDFNGLKRKEIVWTRKQVM